MSIVTSVASIVDFLEIAAVELGLPKQNRNAWINQTREALNDISIFTVSDYFLSVFSVNKKLLQRSRETFNVSTSHAMLTGAFTLFCSDSNFPSLIVMLRSAAVEMHRLEERREPWCQSAWSKLHNIGIFTVKDFFVGCLEINTQLEELSIRPFGQNQLQRMLHATYLHLRGFY